MKTQIITLESHDDLISVRDRLSWAKTPRVLLVWPKYAKVALRFVDLKVLQRHVESLGSQLGLVTRRASVRRDAEALGIPVFDSTTAAQKDLWPARRLKGHRAPRPPRRDLRVLRDSVHEPEAKWRANPFVRVAAFSMAVLAVLAIASLFVPRAALTLYPEAQTQSILIPVIANELIESVSITGSVPVQTVHVTVSDAQTLTVTGKIKIPQAKAKGLARFKNLSDSEVMIPAGTSVYALNESKAHVNFSTLHETRLPAGVGKFVEVPIQAVLAGADANLPADTIQTVDGGLALSMSVTNPEPTEGGAERTARGASEDDRTRLRALLLKTIEAKAKDELTKARSAHDLILFDTIIVSEIKEETYDPPIGQPGSSLKLIMAVDYQAQVVAGDDLRQLADATLMASVPPEFLSAPDSLKFSVQSTPVIGEDNSISFELKAEQTLLRKTNESQVLEYVGGRSKENAIANLQAGLILRQPPKIELSPVWWPWMPLIPFRISIETK
ncbi:MAG: baseplate J/gp47 family protein [Anaerolineales bacterium]|nr:baseplate J/gp47 family protein [Anaerolineales bacterium]